MSMTELKSKDRVFWSSESGLRPNNVKYGNSQFVFSIQLETCTSWIPEQEVLCGKTCIE